MSDDGRTEKPWSVAALKPGDEVGIDITWGDRVSRAVGVVAAIHENGVIELDGDEWFFADGRCMYSPYSRRLAPPTDEGRRESLREAIGVDLSILGSRTRNMPLEELRRLKAAIDEIIPEEPDEA